MKRSEAFEFMAESLINGQLTQARDLAKRRSAVAICDYLHDELGWSLETSVAATRYLKTGQGFQTYCDSK
jgi:hypothetical protein